MWKLIIDREQLEAAMRLLVSEGHMTPVGTRLINQILDASPLAGPAPDAELAAEHILEPAEGVIRGRALNPRHSHDGGKTFHEHGKSGLVAHNCCPGCPDAHGSATDG